MKLQPLDFQASKAALTKAALAMATSTGVPSPTLDKLTKKLIDAQVQLPSNLDPRTFSKAIAAAVSSAVTSSPGTIGTQVGAGIEKVIKDSLVEVSGSDDKDLLESIMSYYWVLHRLLWPVLRAAGHGGLTLPAVVRTAGSC